MASRGLSGVLNNLDKAMSDLVASAEAAGDLTAAQLQSEAKRERGWRDRTGAARAGLTGSSQLKMGKITVALAHAVDYGPYLENSNYGRYAIINSTVRSNQHKLAQNVKRLSKI